MARRKNFNNNGNNNGNNNNNNNNYNGGNRNGRNNGQNRHNNNNHNHNNNNNNRGGGNNSNNNYNNSNPPWKKNYNNNYDRNNNSNNNGRNYQNNRNRNNDENNGKVLWENKRDEQVEKDVETFRHQKRQEYDQQMVNGITFNNENDQSNGFGSFQFPTLGGNICGSPGNKGSFGGNGFGGNGFGGQGFGGHGFGGNGAGMLNNGIPITGPKHQIPPEMMIPQRPELIKLVYIVLRLTFQGATLPAPEELNIRIVKENESVALVRISPPRYCLPNCPQILGLRLQHSYDNRLGATFVAGRELDLFLQRGDNAAMAISSMRWTENVAPFNEVWAEVSEFNSGAWEDSRRDALVQRLPTTGDLVCKCGSPMYMTCLNTCRPYCIKGPGM